MLAVPIGAYLSGKLLKEVKLKVPPADELLKVLLGGFIMGVGAQIGGGCNIGHSLTGVSTLAVSSWVATSLSFWATGPWSTSCSSDRCRIWTCSNRRFPGPGGILPGSLFCLKSE